MRRISFLLAAIFIFWAVAAAAAELTILTENLPPLNYVQDGTLVGPSVEIVREIQRRVGSSEPIAVFPWSRAYSMALSDENVVLFSTTHTRERDDKFKWVGPLATKRDILVARKGAGMRIDRLEDAQKVQRIGTLRDDTRHELLESLGFTNLEPVSDEQKNARKLHMGRIDLWAYKQPGLKTVCRLAGIDPNEVEEVFHLRKIDVSIAFSLKTADAIVSKWRAAFEEMQADGTIARIQEKWEVE
jgi:polar amino acid transport system substrate-binding protein